MGKYVLSWGHEKKHEGDYWKCGKSLLQEVIKYEWLSIKVERGDKQQMWESILWRNYKRGKILMKYL